MKEPETRPKNSCIQWSINTNERSWTRLENRNSGTRPVDECVAAFTYRKQDASPLQCPKFGLGKRWRRSCNFLRIEHQASNMRTASTRRSTSKNTNAAFSPEISTSKRWNVMAEQRDPSNREWKISSSVVTSAEKHNKGSHSQAKRTWNTRHEASNYVFEINKNEIRMKGWWGIFADL